MTNIINEFWEHSYCDNCFYGRTKLAEKILQLISQLK